MELWNGNLPASYDYNLILPPCEIVHASILSPIRYTCYKSNHVSVLWSYCCVRAEYCLPQIDRLSWTSRRHYYSPSPPPVINLSDDYPELCEDPFDFAHGMSDPSVIHPRHQTSPACILGINSWHLDCPTKHSSSTSVAAVSYTSLASPSLALSPSSLAPLSSPFSLRPLPCHINRYSTTSCFTTTATTTTNAYSTTYVFSSTTRVTVVQQLLYSLVTPVSAPPTKALSSSVSTSPPGYQNTSPPTVSSSLSPHTFSRGVSLSSSLPPPPGFPWSPAPHP